MKAISKLGGRTWMLVAALVCMIVAGSVSALAVPPSEILVISSDRIISGLCCFSWGETVKVTEPAKVSPVVVIWNTDYTTGGIFYAGLSVNGGPCTAYGPRTMENYIHQTIRTTRSFAWVVKPSDGLVPGTNAFTLCGGAAPTSENSSLVMGARTLTAQTEK